MLEPFIYLVSGVMKLWHIFFYSLLGLDDSVAWLASMVGLVVTVRLIIMPFFWIQTTSARISIQMRPEIAALEKEYAQRSDKESIAEYQEKRRAVTKKYNYRPAAGCLPGLIQLPFFIGLYRVMLHMARPSADMSVNPDYKIGFLNAEDISAFMETEFRGVPLPAYVAMRPEALAELGTTAEAVRTLVLPLLLLAICFTTVNMIFAILRNRKTMNWDSKIIRGLSKFLIVLLIFLPLMLYSAAMFGPLPVAIILYWFANNLWTLVQNNSIYALVHRRMPLDESYAQFQEESKQTVLSALKEKRAVKWDARRRKAKALVTPWTIPATARELKEEKRVRQEVSAEKRAERKAIAKAKREASYELTKERRAARREQRRLQKEQGEAPTGESSQPEREGSGEPKSSADPENQQDQKD